VEAKRIIASREVELSCLFSREHGNVNVSLIMVEYETFSVLLLFTELFM